MAPSKFMAPSEILRQKAKEFWEEMKDVKIPDLTTGKTSDQIIDDILEHEKTRTGVDWKAAAASGQEAIKAAMDQAQQHLKTLCSTLSKDEVKTAKAMGLLTESGEINGLDSSLGAMSDVAPIPSSATPYTVWGWDAAHAKEFQDATGDRIEKLVLNLVRNFQVMENDDAQFMAKVFMDLGMWGVGLVGVKAAWSIISTVLELSEATELYAIFEGVMTVGASVITLAISVFILAVIVPIFLLMQKDAAGLMVILNDTSEDLELQEIHTTHGKVVGVFKSDASVDNEEPIIPKKLPAIVNPITGEVVAETSIQAGFFAAQKRDDALYGTQGAFKFGATKAFPTGAYIGWSVPLTGMGGKNAVHVDANYTKSVKSFSDATAQHGKRDETSVCASTNSSITGRVNSSKGSEAYYIINVSE